MEIAQNHYVYEWVRPDYNVAFYVGKGSGNRAWDFKRNKRATDIINYLQKNGMVPQVRILARFLTKERAFDFEIERIAFWRDLGELTNQTRGGDGMDGDLIRGKNAIMRRPGVSDKCSKSNVEFFQTDKGRAVAAERGKKLSVFCRTDEGIAMLAVRGKNLSIKLKNFYASEEGKNAARQRGNNLIDFYKTEKGRELAAQIGRSREEFNKTLQGIQVLKEIGAKISAANRGGGNGRAKITEKEAMEIFLDLRDAKEIAKSYGLSTSMIYDIKSKRSWKHIHKEPSNG